MKTHSERKQVPTPSINQLAALAHQVTGHHVRWHLDGPKGEWDGTRISIRHGMSLAQTRCTLAHEIAHAQHHDPCGHDDRAEHRADRRAAHLLITPMAYAQAEKTFDGDINRIAEELTVTVHLAQVWRTHYDNIRRTA